LAETVLSAYLRITTSSLLVLIHIHLTPENTNNPCLPYSCAFGRHPNFVWRHGPSNWNRVRANIWPWRCAIDSV